MNTKAEMNKKKYYVLPVNDKKGRIQCFIRTLDNPDSFIFDFSAAVCADDPAYFVYVDVTRFSGLNIMLTDRDGKEIPHTFHEGLPEVDKIENGKFLRPLIHYTATTGWINDPNGLIFADGKYHMFYQHNPMSVEWGNMHWGHAVSDDLFHWQDHGDELFPDETGLMFSGSAICDENNVAGFGAGAVILFYTAAPHGNELSIGRETSQCIAYSTDGGNTFTKYEKNPIIPHITSLNRDPKVIYSDEIKKFIMALYLDAHTYALFTSENLLDWEKFQEIEMPLDNECPDFYPLRVKNDGSVKWVLSGAHDTYIVGNLTKDGFKPIQENLKYSINPACRSYAAQTFSGIPNGRRIRIAWEHTKSDGAVFCSQMSLPCEMSLRNVDGVFRLSSEPIYEIRSLVKQFNNRIRLTDKGPFTVAVPKFFKDCAALAELSMTEECAPFTISCFGEDIYVCPAENYFIHGGEKVQLSYTGKLQMRIIYDTLTSEVFADGGLIHSVMCMTADRDKTMTVSTEAPLDLSIYIQALSLET